LCFIGSIAAGLIFLMLAIFVFGVAGYRWYYYERNPSSIP